MDTSQQHPEFFVPGDSADLHHTQAHFEKRENHVEAKTIEVEVYRPSMTRKSLRDCPVIMSGVLGSARRKTEAA